MQRLTCSQRVAPHPTLGSASTDIPRRSDRHGSRIAIRCSSVKGTTLRFSRGVSTKRGFVQAAISRASLSFTQSGPGCCVLGKPYLLR